MLRSAGPNLKQRDRFCEPLQRRLADRRELERFPGAELTHDIRDQHLAGFRTVCDPGCQLDGRPEKIVFLGYGFPGVYADAYPYLAAGEVPLHLERSGHGGRANANYPGTANGLVRTERARSFVGDG